MKSEVNQVLDYFVSDCLPKLKSIPASLDPEDIENLPIKGVPSYEFNLIATGEFASIVGEEIIASLPGWFYQCGPCWFLRIDWQRYARGLIVPIRNRGGICALRVFRSALDKRPLELRTRERRPA